jgi:hypothetical protein
MKPKTKTILFILLSFTLGIFVGWFAEDLIIVKQKHTPKNFQQILTERLHLDERQIAVVDSILDRRKQQMESHKKRMLVMRDSVQMEIRKVLREDQAKLFDKIIQEMAEKPAMKPHEPPNK